MAKAKWQKSMEKRKRSSKNKMTKIQFWNKQKRMRRDNGKQTKKTKKKQKGKQKIIFSGQGDWHATQRTNKVLRARGETESQRQREREGRELKLVLANGKKATSTSPSKCALNMRSNCDFADSNLAQLLILHGLATRQKDKNNKNSCSGCSSWGYYHYEIPTSFGWVIRVCILHWGLEILLDFFVLFAFFSFFFFCNDGDDGVSCYCQHFSGQTSGSVTPAPSLPPRLVFVWLMAGKWWRNQSAAA